MRSWVTLEQHLEVFDVIVVESRIAGSAVAFTLARAGRRVVVLDRTVPCDTVSTHLMVPEGCRAGQPAASTRSSARTRSSRGREDPCAQDLEAS